MHCAVGVDLGHVARVAVHDHRDGCARVDRRGDRASDQISQNPEGGGLMLTMDANKEELKNTPTFKFKKEQDAEKQAAERPRVNVPAPTPQPKN
jgi:hypothetical protein